MSSIHSIGSRAASVRSFHRQNCNSPRHLLALPKEGRPSPRSAPVSPVKGSAALKTLSARRFSHSSGVLQSKESHLRRSSPSTSSTSSYYLFDTSTSASSLASFEVESDSSCRLSSGSICTLSSFLSSTSSHLLEFFFSQVEVEERSGLCARSSVHLVESGMASYGSIAFQMQDATREGAGGCEFVYKALKILSRTVGVTILLGLVLLVPFLMVIMGVQYLHECPLETHIPIYLLVGGCFGFLKFLWLLCRQVRSRRYEHIDDEFAEDGLEEMFSSTSYKATDIALSLFLFVWFGLGNYWVISIYPPNYETSLWQPNDWCSKTVYIFAIVQLLFVHVVLGCFFLLCFCLCCGQKCMEVFGDSYK